MKINGVTERLMNYLWVFYSAKTKLKFVLPWMLAEILEHFLNMESWLLLPKKSNHSFLTKKKTQKRVLIPYSSRC